MIVKPGHPPVQSDLLGAPPGGHQAQRPARRRSSGRTPRKTTAHPAAFPAPLPDEQGNQTAETHRNAPKKQEKPLQGDLFAAPLPPRPAPPRTQFDPEELRISIAPASGFSPQATADGWLYLATEPDTASQFLTQGLPLRKTHSLVLTERGGVAHWLAKLTDDPPGLFATTPVVLRVRRTMVMAWLEPDPDHSAEFSAPSYLLSRSRQEQD